VDRKLNITVNGKFDDDVFVERMD